MELSINQIAQLLNGTVEGDSAKVVNGIGKIEDASPNELTFLSNRKYEHFIYSSNAGAILVAEDLEPSQEIPTTIIKVKDPYLAFTMLLKEYERQTTVRKTGIEEPSYASSSANVGEGVYRGAFSYVGNDTVIGKNAEIHPHVFIGDNVRIGDNCTIYSGAKVLKGSVLGNNVTLHSGAVVGSDGFGFAPKDDGTYDSIPQLGNVVVEDDVSIGVNTVIDRATLPGESTLVSKGAKLDNLIQIAHNVKVGESTVMAAQTGISGSTKIGKYCLFAGQVGIAGHLEIADNTQIGAQAGISKSIKETGQKVIGYPAFNISDYFKSYSVFKRLPEISGKVKILEEKVLNLPEFSDKDEH